MGIVAGDMESGLLPSGRNLAVEHYQNLAARWAVQQAILGLKITPQTVLAAPAHVGDSSVQIDAGADDGVDAMEAAGLLSFYTLTDEESIPIREDWDGSATIPFDFTGMDYTGLRFEHAAGERVGSNLYVATPFTLDHMLDFNQPVIYMTMMRHRRQVASGSEVRPVYTLRIEYRVQEEQSRSVSLDGAMMNPIVWSFRMQEQAMKAMELIANQLAKNWTLMTDLGPAALGQLDPRVPDSDIWDESYSSVIYSQGKLAFSAAATLPISMIWKFLDG